MPWNNRGMGESDDLRTFIREMIALSERRSNAFVAKLDRHAEKAAKERRRYFEQLKAKDDEIIAENRAQREALFRILDRMDGNGGTAPAG